MVLWQDTALAEDIPTRYLQDRVPFLWLFKREENRQMRLSLLNTGNTGAFVDDEVFHFGQNDLFWPGPATQKK